MYCGRVKSIPDTGEDSFSVQYGQGLILVRLDGNVVTIYHYFNYIAQCLTFSKIFIYFVDMSCKFTMPQLFPYCCSFSKVVKQLEENNVELGIMA